MISVNVNLSSVAEVSAGNPAPQAATCFGEQGTPFIRAGSLDSLLNGHTESDLEKVTPEAVERHRLRLFPAGTVVFAKSGMSAKLGRVYRLSQPAHVVSHLAAIIGGSELDSRYLQRYLEFAPPSRLIPNDAYPSINLKTLSQLQIPLPPLSEQRRIADILDKADAIRRKRREAASDYENLRLAIFYSVFGRKFLKDGSTIPLGELVDGERGISYGVVQRGLDDSQGVPVARISNIAGNRFDGANYVRVSQAISDQYRRTLLQGSEVLVSIRGTVGRVAVAPESAAGWNVSREVAVIPLLDGVSPVFVRQLMLTDEAQRFIAGNVRGVAQRGINLRDLRDLPVPEPRSDKVQEVLRRMGVLSDITTRWRSACGDSSTLFKSLVQRAFAGEL